MTVPLIVVSIAAGVVVVHDLVFAANLIVGRPVTVPSRIDARLTTAPLPQVVGEVVNPSPDDLLEFPVWVRWLCAAPTLVHALTVTVATVLVTTAIGRLAGAGYRQGGRARPWRVLAALLAAGFVLQGAVDVVAAVVLCDPANRLTGVITAPSWPWTLITSAALGRSVYHQSGQHHLDRLPPGHGLSDRTQ